MRPWSRVVGALVWRDIQLELTSRIPFLFEVLGALGALTLYFFIGQFTRPLSEVAAVGFFAYAVGGLAMLRMQAALTRTILAMDRDQATGTLELALLSPAPVTLVAIGSSLYEIARGVIFAGFMIVTARFVFGAGLTLGPRAWPGLACGLIGGAGFFLILSVLAAAVLVAFKQGVAFALLLGIGLPVLSGAFFPIRVLPGALEAIANVLPLTSAVTLIRDGIVSATFSAGLAVTMALSLVVLAPIAAYVFRLSVDRARRLGTLGHQ
jgi:ABC-type multidrug transport system permease subunit